VASGVPTSVAEATGADDANPLFGEFDVSPAGDRLVYLDKANTNTANMYVETIGTGTRTLLASAPVFDPSWSPGGTHIAYTVDNGTGLVTLKPDGSDSRLFQPSSGKRYQYPRWSPDSAHLAFLQRSGRLLATYRTGRIEVATGVVTILDADLTPTGWRNP
ncbi:MAG: hypothetical protein L6Q95_19830, partial [Planctomycetes bacterium]|nr:hypothetical protein [Planctomycetota bacterium]